MQLRADERRRDVLVREHTRVRGRIRARQSGLGRLCAGVQVRLQQDQEPLSATADL